MNTNVPDLSPHKYWIAVLVLFIIPISGLSIDIYVPSLPSVSHYFNVDKASVQLTITTYMIGLGIMQLFAGMISDSYGRRKPFLYALFAYFIATSVIPFSQNIHQLLLLRFIQGASVAITVVPMRSVIPDIFEGKELLKWFTYMTVAWSIGPVIAPWIGGYLQHYFSWHANFIFLAIYSAVFLVLMFLYLPETSKHYHPFHIGTSIKKYVEFLKNKHFRNGLCMNGALYSFIILFSVTGPFIIQTTLHYTAVQFGYVALLMGLAWLLGATTNRLLIDVCLRTKVLFSLWSTFLIVLSMLGASLLFPMNLYTIVVPLFGILWLSGIIFPNYFARSVSIFPTSTGSANALFGSSVFIISGFSSSIGTFLKASSDIPLILAYLGISIFCLFVFYSDGQ